jgi:hypothetical protein
LLESGDMGSRGDLVLLPAAINALMEGNAINVATPALADFSMKFLLVVCFMI